MARRRLDYLQNFDPQGASRGGARPRVARREMQRLDPQANQLGVKPRPRVARRNQATPTGNMNEVVKQGNTTNNAIEASVYSNVPKVTDGYDSRAGTTTTSITDPIRGAYQAAENLSKPYDVASDPLYKQLSELQAGRVAEQFAARGMEYSTAAQERMEQVRMNMGLEFEDRYRRRQLDALGAYQTIQGMEVTQRGEDVGQYGLSLSPETRDLVRTAETLTPEEWSFAHEYKQDYAAAMQNFEKGTREYQILEAARFNKVMADPAEYAEYLTRDYGMSPLEVEGMVQSQLLAEAEQMITDEKGMLELEKLKADLAKKEVDLETALLKAKYLPDELKIKYLTSQYNLSKAKSDASLKAESLRKALAKSDPMVKNAFLSWSKKENNGVSISEWLQRPTEDGKTIGDKLSQETIDGLVQMAKAQGLIQSEASKMNPFELLMLERMKNGDFDLGGGEGGEE